MNADIAAAAAISASKLSGYPSDATKFLAGDGTWKAASDPNATTVLDRKTSQTAVSNTTTETAVYSLSVPGNTLGTNRMLRFTGSGTLDQNNATTDTITWRLKYGAGTIASFTWSPGQLSGSSQQHIVEFWIQAWGATGSQIGAFFLARGSGFSGNAGVQGVSAVGSVSVDSTLAQNLQFTVQFNAASANLTYTLYNGVLVLI